TMSDADTVIPATVEYLNPKSFSLSNILDVSLIWNCLNTSAMMDDRYFLPNAFGAGIASITVLTLTPFLTKYLSGVWLSRLSSVGSFKNGNELGKMLLKMTLPSVVIK